MFFVPDIMHGGHGLLDLSPLTLREDFRTGLALLLGFNAETLGVRY